LPAHVFHTFMEDAEKGLPVKPLSALAAMPAVQVQTDPAPAVPVAASVPAEKPPATIEDILNRLAGNATPSSATSP